jgi:DNA polymerase-1
MQFPFHDFHEVWAVDFEFEAKPGNLPNPICLVAVELASKRSIRIFQDELRSLKSPPYPIGPNSLFVAFYSSAELGCHLALDWPLPVNVLDLFVEFRNLTNGLDLPAGASLLGALLYFGHDPMDSIEKNEMRQLALRGGPYNAEEKQALLDYCEGDVLALCKLLNSMGPRLDLPRALLRGRYMKAVARIERAGVPIDTASLTVLQEHWENIQDELIRRVDAGHGIYEGRSFKHDRFVRWLHEHQIPWPRLPSGNLALDEDTFHLMERMHPHLQAVRQLRATLSQMRLSDLAVGHDRRNRTLLSPFRARTGRNQPSNSKYIFGTAVWLRSLIEAPPGKGIAYVDWAQQEFGIAAALSSDPAMMEAYASGDPYLAFAKQARAIPPDGTKATHRTIRDQFKQCALAVLFGMGADSLAVNIGAPVFQSRELLRFHHETYPKFWCWSDAAVDYSMLYGTLHTVFGWTIHVGPRANPRMLRNFPMQANGAEMLRLACCFATERGITVCATVHDALLIEAPIADLETAVQETQNAMAEASECVLGGFRLRSDVKLIRHPDRFEDERGKRMWATIRDIVNELRAVGACA